MGTEDDRLSRETHTLTATGVAPAGPEQELARGAAFGRYIVLERLGSGGMGVVYAAYDPELDRKVAVKILKPEAVQDQSRLRREAQAMARLQHPNVIAVHDAGMVGERAFVAMELVDGTTLAHWLDEREHSWSEIVEVFLDAGRGLAAAHAMGLIHRDFKPANVLVSRDGRVRVVDFGLARSVDEPSTAGDVAGMSPSSPLLGDTITRTGTLLGTPTYMSPEQFSGEPTSAKSDQFSFCVALYRALYHVRPFEGEDLTTIRKTLAAGRPPTPPKDSRVPSWVRDVVLRGLSIDPARRWPSLDELLRALGRNPARIRRRWMFAGGVVIALALVAFGIRGLQRRQSLVCRGAERNLAGVWDAGRRQAVHAAFAATGKSYAEDAFASVARSLDRFASDWTAMHTEACEATRVRRSQSEELLDLRMECLGQRLQEAKAQVDLYSVADATVAMKAPQMAASLSSLVQCADVAALRAPVRPPADAATRAKVDSLRAKIAQAKTLQRAMRKKEGLVIAESVAVDARALKYRPLEAQALITLGTLQTELGDAEKARHTLEEGVLAAVAGRDARDEVYGAAAMEHLEAGLNHIEQGEAWEKRGEAAMEALGGSDLDPLATLLQRAADIYSARGEFEKALERDRRLLAIREKNDGPDSVATSVARVNMGRELVALGRFPEAKPLLLRGVAGLEKELGPTHVNVGWALITLATAQSKTGRRDECIRTLQRAVEIYDKGFGPEHSQLALPLANLGTAYLEAGKFDEGVAMLRRSRDITAKTLGPDHPFVGLATLNIGNALLMQDKYEAAQEQFARALTILQKGLTPDHSLIASALASNAIADVKLHHAARALPVLERTLTMPTQNAVDLGQRRFWLASALWDSGGDRVRARKLAQQARTECASGGEDTKKDVTEIDAWIAAHH